jgi:hypothetical protein
MFTELHKIDGRFSLDMSTDLDDLAGVPARTSRASAA